MTADLIKRWVRAGLITGITDGLFAIVLSTMFFNSTVLRLWLGVASVPFGKEALGGGVGTEIIGVLLHFTVAFTWSAIFVCIFVRSPSVRRTLDTRGGILKVAAIYGPLIWLVMSLIVIPVVAHRMPNITSRWWIQLVGHFPFVGLPMVASVAGITIGRKTGHP
jgi:hypothetical protein